MPMAAVARSRHREGAGWRSTRARVGPRTSHAAVALKAAISETNLRAALDTRDVIGQAKGVLMQRERLGADAAFARLQQLSQDHNRPLRDIAEDLARTGHVPD
jgi:AmiR/NasT family two-component response regulator